MRFVTSLALAVALAACGGPQQRAHESSAFECKGRRASYHVQGGIMGASYDVRLFCDGNQPLAEETRVGKGGVEEKRGARISADTWEAVWKDIEDTGWRMVTDCKAVDMDEKSPFWVFEVGDEDKQISVTCKTATLPYPFDALQNALDKARAELPVKEGGGD
jgi:hypothetical protein